MANDLVAELQSVRRWIGNGSRGAVGMQKKIDGISAEIERLRASKPIAEGATDNGMKPLTGDALRSAVDQYCGSTNDTPVERLTNGSYEPDDMGPIGDAARRIASYCDGEARKNVYRKAKQELASLATDAPVSGSLGALTEIRDLLTERIYGNPARSPAHNARVKVDTLIASLSSPSGEPAVGDCTCERYPTHCANDCPTHGLSEPTYTAGERMDVPPTLTDTADTPPASAVERAAQAIYEHWAFDDRAPNPKPKWVPGGNSEKQDIARRLARAALTTAPTTGVVDCLICHNNGSDCQACVGGAMTTEQAAEWLRAQAIATAPTAPVDREAVISAIEAKIGGVFHGATGRAVATEIYDAIVSLLPKIPEGWVLVPREPTEAMINAAVDAVLDYNHNDDHAPHQIHKDAWSAMIAASPNPGEGA